MTFKLQVPRHAPSNLFKNSYTFKITAIFSFLLIKMKHSYYFLSLNLFNMRYIPCLSKSKLWRERNTLCRVCIYVYVYMYICIYIYDPNSKGKENSMVPPVNSPVRWGGKCLFICWIIKKIRNLLFLKTKQCFAIKYMIKVNPKITRICSLQ